MAKPTTSEPGGGSRRILTLGSLGLTLLGLALLGYDVFTEVQRGNGWLPLIGGTLGLIAAALWSAIDDSVAERPTVVLEPPPPTPDAAGDGPFREGAVTPPTPSPYPARRWLPWIAAGAIAAIVLQGVVPLRYYFGDDAYDERFSWRMFSAVRMHECDLSASETVNGTAQPVRLMQTIHAGWVTTLRRNREAVMARYLRWRCTQEDVERARLENRCVTPEGRRVPPIVREIDCATDEITAEGGAP